MGIKIGDDVLTNLAVSAVLDPTKLHLPMADRQAGAPGTNADLTLDILYQALTYRLYPATSHTLVSGDVGKPLSGKALFDNESATSRFSHVLTQVVSSSQLRVAPRGAELTIAVALLQNGNAYNPADANDGRYVWWDKTAGIYKKDWPPASHTSAREVLEIISVGSSTFLARVL